MNLIDKPRKLSERIVNAVTDVIFDHFKNGPKDELNKQLAKDMVQAIEVELLLARPSVEHGRVDLQELAKSLGEGDAGQIMLPKDRGVIIIAIDLKTNDAGWTATVPESRTMAFLAAILGDRRH